MSRRSDLATIHIGAKKLGLIAADGDKSLYQDMLWAIARVRSAADLDEHGRRQVLAHLRKSGFKAKPPRSRHKVAIAKERLPLVKKIRAQLFAAGRRPDAYADSIAQQMFGIARFEWCKPPQLVKIVAALEYDRMRREERMASRSVTETTNQEGACE